MSKYNSKKETLIEYLKRINGNKNTKPKFDPKLGREPTADDILDMIRKRSGVTQEDIDNYDPFAEGFFDKD